MSTSAENHGRFDLQDRFIEFAIAIVKVVSTLESDRVSIHLGGQLLRSGTSPALNYAEALGAESRKDFVHKMRIVLKELRETAVCLKILSRVSNLDEVHPVHQECYELTAIIAKSIATARRNMQAQVKT